MTRRALALFLVLTLLLAPAALASQALGWELYQTDTVLGSGLSVSSQVLWGDSKQDYRREQYAVYTPGQGTSPVVCYSSYVPTTATLTNMAKGLEEYGYRVLAGANGDYFVMSTGVPLGMVVSYGVLRSSSSYHYAVGFDADGAAFVGKPDLRITASFHGCDLTVSGGYNKSRNAKDGYFLYSSDFGPATKAGGSGINVVLRPVTVPEDYVAPARPEPLRPAPVEPPLDEAVTGPADPNAQSTDPAAAPIDPNASGDPAEAVDPAAEPAQPGAHALWEQDMAAWEQEKLAWEQAMAQWKLALAQSVAGFETVNAQLTIGGEVECVVESVSDQSGSVAIPEGRFVLSISKSGGDFLVSEAASLLVGERLKVRVESADPRWNTAYSAIGAYEYILQDGVVPSGLSQSGDPRTALGVKPDGTVILYTIDGRRSGHSVGASVGQVAKRLLELGCTQAVLFDGGGSTSFGTTGALDQSFALQNRPSEGSQRAVSNALFFVSDLQPTGVLGSVHLQPQSALMLSGARQSLTGLGIDTGYYPLGGEPLGDLTYTVDGPGTMEGDVFIAGAERGIATVTAKTPDGATGTARMTVVATPDVITLTDASGQKVTALNLDPGQTASLNAAATWYKLPLLADDSCFAWALPETLGTVDAYGNLTAGRSAGAGQLTVTAGERSVSIPVTVGGHVTEVNALEGDLSGFAGPDVLCAPETSQVRYGKQSLRVDYPTDRAANVTCDLPIAPGETFLGCWVYGDGSALTVTADLTLDDGTQTAVTLTDQPFTGWKQLLVPIPENTVKVSALTLTPGEGSTGRVYFDHFLSANGPLYDTTPPAAKLSVTNGAVSATLSDNVDKTFRPENLSLTLDGWSVDFTLAGNTLSASIPQDTLLHRLSLTVRDESGNLKRASVELAPAAGRQPPFLDIAGHWAQDHITYLYDQGVTNGRAAEGGFVFDPQTNITRGEFAAMLARWQRADLSGETGADLPFVDAGDIPSWALPAVSYLNKTGVMAGSLEGDGLYAKAGDPITRAQAMTMLGRVQPRGFTPADTVFADHGDIPTWAAEYVYTLAGQKVVSGYEGLVRPNDPITRGEVAKLLTTLW